MFRFETQEINIFKEKPTLLEMLQKQIKFKDLLS